MEKAPSMATGRDTDPRPLSRLEKRKAQAASSERTHLEKKTDMLRRYRKDKDISLVFSSTTPETIIKGKSRRTASRIRGKEIGSFHITPRGKNLGKSNEVIGPFRILGEEIMEFFIRLSRHS